MSVRFSNKLVAELFQSFWAAWQAGEFLTDAAALAGTHRHRGLAWVREAGGVRPRKELRDNFADLHDSRPIGPELDLLNHLDHGTDLGYPVMVGVSRKGFLGQLLAGATGTPRPAVHRDDATTAVTALLALRRIWAVRTHTARPHRDAIATALRMQL